MKNMLKKNQIVLTVLAVMIAVAGYLTYTGANKDLLNAGTDNVMNENTGLMDISDEDILAENKALQDANAGDPATDETNGQPGEAVLTGSSNTSVIDFMAEIQLNREQVRTKNKETLLEIINNTNISDEQKQTAIDNMVKMTEYAEKENATETLLSTKGFENTVVSINDNSVDVVIGMTEITDAQRAQIEDIVKRKTEVPAEYIVISLMPKE